MIYIMRRTSFLFFTVLLAACTNTQPSARQPTNQPVEEAGQTIEKELSWEEKTIAEIVKYEGWKEKNLDLSMEQLIAKKEACLKYANATYGEGFAILGNGAREYNEHRYISRFDRCFTKRKYSDDGGRGMNPISTTTIIDVISERALFSRNDDCEHQIVEKIVESGLSQQEYREQFRCPSDGDMRRLWDALMDTNS